MDFATEMRRAGLAPATEKEKLELQAAAGVFYITGEDDEVDPATEAAGFPVLRFSKPAVAGQRVVLDTSKLRDLPIKEPGQQFMLEADGGVQPIRRDVETSDGVGKYMCLFPSDISLESCAEPFEAHRKSKLNHCIEFRTISFLDIDKIEHARNCHPDDQDDIPTRVVVGLPNFPLYHAHVIWNCHLALYFSKGTFTIALDDGASSLVNRSFLNHFGGDDETRQAPPPMIAHVQFGVCGNPPAYECKKAGERLKDGRIVFEPTFNYDDMKKEIDKHPKPHYFTFGLSILVPRSYFDLSKIIDLSEIPPTVPDEPAQLATAILCGEKPSGADWAITVAKNYRNPRGGDTQQKTFYMHRGPFASISDRFKTAVRGGGSMWKDSLVIVKGENRCLLPRLTANDMQVVIPLIYGLPVPLPEAREATLVESLRRLFNEDHLKTVLAPQWERLICKRALALDPKQVSTFASVYRLLAIIWSFPRGWMPVAKRVAIGVMADTVHLNAGRDDEKFIEARWKTIRAAALNADDIEHWPAIKRSMIKHLYLVSSVLKYGNDVMPTTDPEADDVTDEELAGGDNQQKLDDVIKKESEDVAVEASTLKKEFEAIDVNDEEEWHDVAEEAGGSASARKSCAIS